MMNAGVDLSGVRTTRQSQVPIKVPKRDAL